MIDARGSPSRRRCPGSRPASAPGALVEMTPQPATRNRQREQPEPGEEMGHGREAITDGRDLPPGAPGRAGATRRVSVRGPGAWPRAGGPSCRPRARRVGARRRAAAALGVGRWRDGAGCALGRRFGRRRRRRGGRRSPVAVAIGATRRRRLGAHRRSGRGPGPVPGGQQARVRRRPGAHAGRVGRRRSSARRRRPRTRGGPTDTRRSAMSSGHRSSARMSRSGHRSVYRLVAVRLRIQGSSGARTSAPPVAFRRAARKGSFAPSSRYSAEVGATSPMVRPSGEVPGLIWVTRTA